MERMTHGESISEHGRVCLRPLEMTDAPCLAAYRSHPDVARLQSWTTYTLEQAEALCRTMQGRAIDTPGTWLQLAIVLTDTGEMIGDCGLHFPGAGEPGHGTEIEIGITLAREHQGKGLVSDAIAAIVDLAFAQLGKEVVRASIDALNAPAAAMLARAGFARPSETARRTMFKGEWRNELDYVLRAPRASEGASSHATGLG
ncbi:MAG: GNAT family N-acetyltransferase [Phycisphaerales bacterium]|nr:GNAT family N-acetyltransferase [Phycisphaerales bacterium]